MPNPKGLFDSFENLDSITTESLLPWIKNPPSLIQLENYLASKILYPQTIPLTQTDMKIDLAILREILRINAQMYDQKAGPMLGDSPFLNVTLRKIIIPEGFLRYVPDLVTLTWAFVDGLLLNKKRGDAFEDLWTIVVESEADEVVGSLILPNFESSQDLMNLTVLGRDYQIKKGSLIIIPCQRERCEIAYKLKGGSLLGKSENAVEIYGGKLGLMVDGRLQ